MAGFDEMIVREYFELHGFMVRQLRKYQTSSRKKLAEEEIALYISNLSTASRLREPNFLLFTSELVHIERAVVAVIGWHTQTRFTPSMLNKSSEIFSFLQKHVLKLTEDFFDGTGADELSTPGTAKLYRILVLPGLPTAEPHRSQSIELLKEKGVDAIISFRAMLIDILDNVEADRNYTKSDALQILRILKNYDLVKAPQMELFKDE